MRTDSHLLWEVVSYLYSIKKEINLQEFGRQMAICTYLSWVSPSSAKFQEKKIKKCGCGIIASVIRISVQLIIRGLPNISFFDRVCRNCVAGKHSRSKFPSSST